MGKIPSREKQEGVREFENPRSRSGQEAHIVRGWESEDFKGNKIAVGNIQSEGEESYEGLAKPRRPRRQAAVYTYATLRHEHRRTTCRISRPSLF